MPNLLNCLTLQVGVEVSPQGNHPDKYYIPEQTKVSKTSSRKDTNIIGTAELKDAKTTSFAFFSCLETRNSPPAF